ncbi:MAG: hypothetical protein NXI30_09325 [bacterium]|nr:hypothetical protein [bacterium]
MSDSNSTEERLDALLSAERDDALEPRERTELDALLASDPAAVERRTAFATIDDALADLGRVPLGEAAIADGLERLRERTGSEASGVVQLDGWRAPWRHPAVPLLAGTAAAALMLYFAIMPSESADTASAPSEIVQRPQSPVREGVVVATPEAVDPFGLEDGDPDFDPELAIALGYGEGPDFVPGVDNADLPVISELDLLDFMASREEGERG